MWVLDCVIRRRRTSKEVGSTAGGLQARYLIFGFLEKQGKVEKQAAFVSLVFLCDQNNTIPMRAQAQFGLILVWLRWVGFFPLGLFRMESYCIFL